MRQLVSRSAFRISSVYENSYPSFRFRNFDFPDAFDGIGEQLGVLLPKFIELRRIHLSNRRLEFFHVRFELRTVLGLLDSLASFLHHRSRSLSRRRQAC